MVEQESKPEATRFGENMYMGKPLISLLLMDKRIHIIPVSSAGVVHIVLHFFKKTVLNKKNIVFVLSLCSWQTE